ncbi:MAG: hypothetical protein GF346_02285 [Candidatus Eisenbacteria bacterium]|nr:hypothetical protein [Candidatus Latescibacterota bacterium]MBD3301256.1 hypothetical protein [Candidatus Eisenbacteria bacterium]
MSDPTRTELQSASETTTASLRSKPLGQLLVALGVLDSRQLANVLQIQKMQPADERLPLGRICVEEGFVSRERLDLILQRWGKRLRLGELLVHQGSVTPAQLEEALERQRGGGGRLGSILLEMEALDEVSLTETLARQYDMAYVPLGDLNLPRDLVRYVNPQFAWRHGVVPIGLIGRRLTVAIQDPTNPTLIRDLEHSTGMQIKAVLSTPSQIAAIARRLYEFGDDNDRTVEPDAGDGDAAPRSGSPADLVRRLVTRAASLSATEITLEPSSNGGDLRLRMGDTTWPVPDAEVFTGRISDLVRTFQTMAHLDPEDPKRPQEGILSVTTDEGDFSHPVLLQIETEPTSCGQALRAEIVPEGRGSSRVELDAVGSRRSRFEELLQSPNGVVLIAGPAGSRKRGLLRGTIPVMTRPDALICSIEEPILRVDERVEQHPVAGPDGPAYLERVEQVLRRDPRAVLLERVPDPAVARRIFELEGTQPLVVTTLQAGNATGAIARLAGMEVDPARLADALRGVLAVRLLRRVCPHCVEDYEPGPAILAEWFQDGDPFSRWIRGAGCSSCRGTGSLGRLVVSELWVPNADDREAIRRGTAPADLRARFLERGSCLGQDALRAAAEGATTLEEALRRIPYQDVLHTRRYGIDPVVAERWRAARRRLA